MKRSRIFPALGLLTASCVAGCGLPAVVEPPAPLGTTINPVLEEQEHNAEAADFILYMHEFALNEAHQDGTNTGGWRLNDDGEDHLKQIAKNIKDGAEHPVVIERSRTSSAEGTEHGYAVHFNDALDKKRRDVVVLALQRLGVGQAETLVTVAPAFPEGLSSSEAASAYQGSFRGRGGFGGGGFGGGFGGFGGFGGGFGGGF